HGADDLGEPLGADGLGDESAHPRRERPLEVSGPAVAGHDQHPAAGHLRAQGCGDLHTVGAGHLEIQHGDVGGVRPRHGQRLGAGGRLGDHPEVVLQGEQGGQRAADQVLVVGEQHPYGLGHEAASPTGPSVASGTSAVSRNRSPPTRPASSRPSTAASRSRSPASPEPPESGARTVPSAPPAGGSPPSPPPAPLPRPAPSFSTVSTTRPSTVRTVTAHQVASPCRSTFVVASRTTQ